MTTYASITRYDKTDFTAVVAPPETKPSLVSMIDLVPIAGTVSIVARIVIGELKALYYSWDIKKTQQDHGPRYTFHFPINDELDAVKKSAMDHFIEGCAMRDQAIYSNKSSLMLSAIATAALWLVGSYFLPATLVATALPLMFQNVCVLFAVQNYNRFISTYHALAEGYESQPTLATSDTYNLKFYYGHISFDKPPENSPTELHQMRRRRGPDDNRLFSGDDDDELNAFVGGGGGGGGDTMAAIQRSDDDDY